MARASERGEASTEDLRHSVRHYRALFVELLEVDDVDDVASTGDRQLEEVRAHNNVERLH
jgi:hypothetical protein